MRKSESVLHQDLLEFTGNDECFNMFFTETFVELLVIVIKVTLCFTRNTSMNAIDIFV